MNRIPFFLEKEVNIPEIRFYVVPDGILGLDQYFNNELDVLAPIFIQIPVNELPMIRVNPRLRKEHTQFVGNTIYSIRFNINYPPVDETLIRKAIIQSIDKYKLTTIVTRGGEYMVNSFIPPKEYVDLKNCININYKPAQAQTRLSETGYPDGVGFPKLFISYEGAEYEKNIAQGLGAIISKNLNIDVELTENEKSHIVLVKRKASYYPGEYLSDLFMPNPLDNQISQSYKKIEILFNQMMLEIDSEKTLNLVKQAEKIMIQNEAVAMPLFVTNDHYLVNTRVKGWKNRFKGQHHLWQWSLQKGMNIK
ncbi:Bacterial extracellular solute-binding protein, family 5 [Candidatus Magnetomorum sp. HK-1]|nr:Bacterial extracellular solute-binding protein, family 5 [Candidatus Magnetomorum sp. HK-1]